MPCNATFQRGQQTNTQKSAYSTGFQQSVRCSSSSLSFPLPSFRSLYLNLFLSTCLLCFRKLNPFISCILHRKTLSTPHSDYDLCTASRISTPFSTLNPSFFFFLFATCSTFQLARDNSTTTTCISTSTPLHLFLTSSSRAHSTAQHSRRYNARPY